jgi:hypothetical protein
VQIHYRPRGDDTVAQLKPIISYCIARFRKGKSTFKIDFFFFHFEHQKFLVESSYMYLILFSLSNASLLKTTGD